MQKEYWSRINEDKHIDNNKLNNIEIDIEQKNVNVNILAPKNKNNIREEDEHQQIIQLAKDKANAINK